ncbi:MAG: hypothetical protein AVDCRST_MAG64-1165 [uncultured Phycisphaerae bacterium]|uniref:DUF4058 domain-containing protein n=1 Tax=uncultured Phycisphaerae bacterium TaxID=904963 RepID=A0A6J4NSC7_9BACT|nr:MAG: hypothetical protein AVDCRST_MAG64-1165 [uncultured Phycisphaerae bacterium]
MPSPFPGMDPYIESSGLWPGFHSKLINVCHELILDRLPPTYDAQINEDVRLTDLATDDPRPSKTFVPDVMVIRDPERRLAGRPEASAVATIEPLVLRAPAAREVRNEWIEILRQPGRDLVTVIEVQSPANKVGSGFAQHQAKRASLVHNGVHFVDVDLLTAGARPVLPDPLPASDYATLVFRADRTDVCDAYLWGVRRPLPTIPIPLRGQEGLVPLDLAAAVAITYDRGRYARSVGYDRPLKVRLADEDLRWAAAVAARAAAAGR